MKRLQILGKENGKGGIGEEEGGGKEEEEAGKSCRTFNVPNEPTGAVANLGLRATII